ncbi:MAG: hypothetical protein KDA75_13775 [Planctomycetaceae bacterium]|nr:hypothetical protein [Planctomycetaceae bacterium]
MRQPTSYVDWDGDLRFIGSDDDRVVCIGRVADCRIRIGRAARRLSRYLAVVALLLGVSPAPADEPAPTMPVLMWESLPDLPDPIGFGGPVVGVHDGVLIVAGGANFPGDPPWSVDGRPPGHKVWYDGVIALVSRPGPKADEPSVIEWKHAGALPFPLAYSATVSTADGVYVLGGETYGKAPASEGAGAETNHPTDEVLLLRWDPSSQSVEVLRDALPRLPRPCQYHAADRIGDCLFVAASHGQSSDSRNLDSKSFWMIDLSQPSGDRKWNSLPAWPGPAREKMALVAQSSSPVGAADSAPTDFPRSLYLIGGSTWATHADGTPDDAHATHFADGYQFDLQAQTWSRIPDLPWVSEHRQVDLPDYRWDERSVSWLTAPGVSAPTSGQLDKLFRARGRPVGAAPAIAWGDRYLIIFSGATGRFVTLPVQLRPEFPRDVLCFDTLTQRWSAIGQLPSGVVTTTAVRWGRKIVIPSGETRPGVRTPAVQAATVEP